jgi:hypothetical protein
MQQTRAARKDRERPILVFLGRMTHQQKVALFKDGGIEMDLQHKEK